MGEPKFYDIYVEMYPYSPQVTKGMHFSNHLFYESTNKVIFDMQTVNEILLLMLTCYL